MFCKKMEVRSTCLYLLLACYFAAGNTINEDDSLMEIMDYMEEEDSQEDVDSLDSNGNLRIVGGDDAEKGAYPYQVSIQYRHDSFHFCGGSIINESWILTAAHCLRAENGEPEHVKIVAGEFDLDEDDGTEQSRNAVKYIIHAEYDATKNSENDIGLIYLEEPFKLNDYVNIIKIPKADESFTEIMCNISGWGKTNSNNLQGYHILQTVEVPVVSDKECEEKCSIALQKKCHVEKTQMCAGYLIGGKDACQGDSGGPMACTDSSEDLVLAGVVSTGYGCAEPFLYGIYTEVSYYKDWIEENMGHGSASMLQLNSLFVIIALLNSMLVS